MKTTNLIFAFTVISFFINLGPVFSQLEELNDDFESHTLYYEGVAEDFIIPDEAAGNGISFTIKGADGGYVKLNDCKSGGGEGATVNYSFMIGDSYGQIPPGTPIRFIVGEGGIPLIEDSPIGSGFGAGGGGGGSAILAYINESWVILAVAGGGGGAYQGLFAWSCVDSQKGQGGRSSTSGGNGSGDFAGSGGSNGNGGTGGGEIGDGDLSGGGGGAFNNGSGGGCFEGEKGYPAGGSGGGHCNPTIDDGSANGGWGFGGGGVGDEGGGAGGGFSGGGGGGTINNGGGGGSYANSIYEFTSEITAGGTNENTLHGKITYQFIEICTGEITGFEYINYLCEEEGLSRIQLIHDIGAGDVCANELDFRLIPDNGQTHFANGQFRRVTQGDYTAQIIHIATGTVMHSFSLSVSVTDTPPTASCNDATINLNTGSYNNANFHSVINNGSTALCDDPLSLSAAPTSFDCNDLGANTVTLTVTGSNDVASTCTATVTVQLPAADTPLASCQPNKTFNLGGGHIVNISSNDIDNGSVLGACFTSMTISPQTFDCDDIGQHTVTLTVNAGATISSSCTTTVTITDNSIPEARCYTPNPINLDENGTASITYNMIDNNSESNNCTSLTYSLSQSDFDCSDVGSSNITMTVTDGYGNSSYCSTAIILQDNTFPTASCRDITISLDENGSYILDPSELDNGSEDICGYSLSASKTVFDCNDIGTVSVNLLVTDAHNNQNNCSANVTVEDNLSPTAICNDYTLSLNAALAPITQYTNVATSLSTDNCSGTLVRTLLSSPVLTCDDIGSNLITYQVRDQQDNTSTCVSKFTLYDSGVPQAFCQNLTISLDETGTASVSAEEVDNESSDNCAITNYMLVPSTFNCTNVGDNVAFLTVTDGNGNSASCSATVTVLQDNTDPVAVCKNPTITLAGQNSIDLEISDIWDEAASEDNCGDVFYVGQDIFELSCNQIGQTVPVLVTIEDADGNEASCTANVTLTGLPCDWTVAPDGIGCDPGEATYDPLSGAFSLTSEGCYDPTHYRQNDTHGFIQTELCGDGQITAQVTSVLGTGYAGISMRESNDPSAAMIQLMIDGVSMSRRELRQTAGSYAFAHVYPTNGKNWLRLSRTGNQFTASRSVDGVTWEHVFITQIPMSNCIEIGLITMNGAPSGEVTGTFANVSIGGISALAAPAGVDIAQPEQSQADFTLFPNPATEVVNLQLGDFDGKPIQARIYNHLGQIVKQLQWEEADYSTRQISVNDLQAGTYIVEIENGTTRMTKKLVVTAF